MKVNIFSLSSPNAICLIVLFFCTINTTFAETAPPPCEPRVAVEEDVYTFADGKNGSGPMWCHGSTSLARIGDEVFITELEVLPETEAAPLNNCRWKLLRRNQEGWTCLYHDKNSRTREPSPIAVFPKLRRVFVSANPTLVEDPKTYGGPARPEIVGFDTQNEMVKHDTLLPKWDGNPVFTEHSYRSFAADGNLGELILFQNCDYTHAEWAFINKKRNWSAQGRLVWPWGADYAKPCPIRICYPNVVLADQKVVFCGVSDIVEPNPEWAKFKEKLTGQKWDYDFRRLFLTWSDDITSGKFHPWLEIASRETTCGWINPCGLWLASDGAIHILWTERAIDTRLRERFFPDAKQSESLRYAVVRDGKIVEQHDIVRHNEGERTPKVSDADFHVTPDQRLWIVYYISGEEKDVQSDTIRNISENRIIEVTEKGSVGAARTIPLTKPFYSFFTATVRAGSSPSTTLDLLGLSQGSGNTMRYASIELFPTKP